MNSRHRRLVLTTSIAALLSGAVAHAQFTWNSAGPTDNWSTAAGNENWLPGGVVWTNGASAIFDITSGAAETINVTTTNVFDNITFDVGGFIISSAGAGSFSLANDLASTITVTNAADVATINETIANNAGGASTLTKAGAGTLVLNGTAVNTFSGGTIISAGTLTASHEGALGTGAVTNNATLNINKANVTFTGLSNALSGTGVTNVTALGTGSQTVTLNGNYSGYTGTWNIGVGAAAGAGKVQMNGADNAGATINVLANGTVYVAAAVTKNASIVLNGGDTGESLGQLRLEGNANWAGSVTLAGAVTGAGDGFIGANNGTGTISGIIGQSGGAQVLSKVGGGTIVLSGLNTYSGGTAILTGALSVSTLNNTGAAGNVGTGSTISIGNAATGATLLYTGAGETTDRVINLAGTTGGTVLNQSAASGLLKITGNLTATGAGSKTLTLTGSTAGTGELSGAIIDNSATNITGVTKSGTGLWTLSGTSTFSGATLVNDGVLRISSAGALGAAGSAAANAPARTQISSTGGRLELTGGISVGEFIHISMRQGAQQNLPALSNFSGNNTITVAVGGLTGGSRVNIESQAGLLTLAGGISQFDGTGGRTFQLMGAGNGLISGAMTNGTGVVGIQKTGTGIWTLSGTNANTGTAQVDAGTLKLDYGTNNTTKLADAAALILNGGTLEISGGTHTEVVASTTLSGGNATITRTSGTAVLNLNTVTPNGGSVTFPANSIATTDNLNSNGILPWARFGANNWGANSTNAADGPIVAYTGAFSDVTRFGGIVPDAIAGNVRVINGGAAGNITLAVAPTTKVNSLLVDASDGPAVIAPTSGTDIFMVGDESGSAIWQTATSGGLTIGSAANDGVLTTGNTANAGAPAITLRNDSANGLTINSSINNNGTDVVTVNKGGTGPVILTGNNGFTGNLTVNQGTLTATGNHGFTGVLTISDGATVILSGNNSARPAATSGRTVLNLGGTLQLQANAGNTTAGISSALSSEQTANQPFTFSNLSTLQLRGDSSVTFSGGNNIGGLNNTVQTIDVNQLTGAGTNQTLTFAPGLIPFGNSVTIAATGGNGYTLGLGTIRNIVTAGGSMILNPTTASMTIGGFENFNNGANNSTLTLAGTATGNFVTGVIANQGTGSTGTGSTTLVKSDTSTWTLTGANTFTGNITINAGTLGLGGAGTLGAGTYAGAIADNGAFVFGSSAAQTLSGLISGSGTLTANGTGTLTLTGANTYTGTTSITSGTVIAQNNAALGNAGTGTTISGTGTLDLGGTLAADAFNLGVEVLTVSGAGVGGNGALVNNGTNQQINATGRIVLAGNATIGGTQRWDLRSSTPTLDMGGFTLTKTGANTVSLVGVTVSNPGNAIINQGVLSVETTTNLGGTSANSFTVNSGGTLQFYQNSNAIPWSIALNSATMQQVNTSTTVSGPVTLTGANTIGVSGTSLTLNGAIGGAGGFTKSGAGLLTVNNANNYLGTTTVTAGTLAIANADALGDSGADTVVSAGTLRLTSGITTNAGESVAITGSGADFFGALQAGTGGGTWAGGVTLGAGVSAPRLGATAGSTLIVTGTIADGAGINLDISGASGTGAVVFNPTTSNTYTGSTGIIRGILRLGKTDALPTGTTLDVDSVSAVVDAATFDMASFNQTIGALQDTAATNLGSSITNSVAATTSVLTVNGGATTTFDGSIQNGAGTVALTRAGSGSLTLTGANTFTGTTTISGGTLQLSRATADNSAIPTDANTATTSDIVINGGALVLAASEQIGNTGSIDMSSGSFSFSGSGRTENIDKFTNSGGTFTTGANTLIVGGATVTWSGGTNTISSGGLVSDKHWIITGGTNTVESNALLRVQSGAAPNGLIFGGTSSPTITVNADNADPGEILLRQDVTVDNTLTAGTARILTGGAGSLPGAVDLDGGTRTFTVNNGSAASDLLISATIQNGAIVKADAGTLTLTGSNTFTGSTTINAGALEAGAAGALGATSAIAVNAGGTLLLSGSGDRIGDAVPLTLSGGTFDTGGLSETLGTLTLTADSVIDFGAGASIITFANSSAIDWNGYRLSIYNWSGNPVSGGGGDQLRFASNGLTSTQLSQIDFYSGTTLASKISITPQFSDNGFVSFGEVVPVPEPSGAATVLGLLGLAGWRERRRAEKARALSRSAK